MTLLFTSLTSSSTSETAIMIYDLKQSRMRYVHRLDLLNLPVRIQMIRSISVVGDRLYALAPSLLLIFRITGKTNGPVLVLEKWVCRAEWVIGGKLQGDLRSIYADKERQQLYVSFAGQCAIDIFDLDGKFLIRKFLWNIAPDCFYLPEMTVGAKLQFGVVNQILSGPNNEILLATAWMNGKLLSSLINFDNGKMIFGEKPFLIQNCLFFNKKLYISEPEKARTRVYDWPKEKKKPKAKLFNELIPKLQNEKDRLRHLRVKGLAVCNNDLICCVHSNRKQRSGVLPSRLISFNMDSLEQKKEHIIPAFTSIKDPLAHSLFALPSNLENIIPSFEDPVIYEDPGFYRDANLHNGEKITPVTNVNLKKQSIPLSGKNKKNSVSVPAKKINIKKTTKESRPTIVLDDVSLYYERSGRKFLSFNKNLRSKKSFWALKNISFSVFEGEAMGIIGRNGSGKSTLSMLCSGILVPDRGSVQIHGKAQMLALGVGFKVELTGRENVFISGSLLGLSKREILSKIEEIEAFAELGEYIDEPMRTYSSGMRSRLGFAVATAVKPDILILDEILAVGDKAFKDKAMQRMRQMQSLARSVIIVSHNPSQLKKLSSRVLWLEKGHMVMIGNPKEVLNAYNDFCKNPSRWLRKNPDFAERICA